MATEKRSPASVADTKYTLGSGPYLGKVVSHLDPSFMGAVEVTLLRQQGNIIGDVNQTYIVRAAPPFYGSTAFEFMGSNEGNYDDTQKSYGMWFVPPDIGITLIVIFIDSNPAEGYWIGCVPSRFANNMVPGIAATDKYVRSQLSTFLGDPRIMPVAEINRRLNDSAQDNNVDNILKAIHPIATRFLEQGLLKDEVRGTTTSSARRDIPSMVFGISTPGPLDKRPGAKRAQIGTRQSLTPNPVPVSRLGGTQFVMDDGNDQFQRKTPAGGENGGPPEYVDVLEGEEGEVTIPKDELVRIRTRTGHQILMHNSEDLIYIGNARGTSWIELSSNGKIDIFADDSISIHTRNDLNIRADRDINLEAGRNVNIKATAQYQSPEKLNEEPKIVDEEGFENGRVHIHSEYNFDLHIGANGRIETTTHTNQAGETVDGHLDIDVTGYMKLHVGSGEKTHNLDIITTRDTFLTTNGDLHIKTEKNSYVLTTEDLHIKTEKNSYVLTTEDLHIKTEKNSYVQTTEDLHIKTGGKNLFSSGGTTDINAGGNLTQTAPRIDLNGPTAAIADDAEDADDATAALEAEKVILLPTYENDDTDARLTWANTEYQAVEPIISILTRIPVHEPWSKHENLDPEAVDKKETDRETEYTDRKENDSNTTSEEGSGGSGVRTAEGDRGYIDWLNNEATTEFLNTRPKSITNALDWEEGKQAYDEYLIGQGQPPYFNSPGVGLDLVERNALTEREAYDGLVAGFTIGYRGGDQIVLDPNGKNVSVGNNRGRDPQRILSDIARTRRNNLIERGADEEEIRRLVGFGATREAVEFFLKIHEARQAAETEGGDIIFEYYRDDSNKLRAVSQDGSITWLEWANGGLESIRQGINAQYPKVNVIFVPRGVQLQTEQVLSRPNATLFEPPPGSPPGGIWEYFQKTTGPQTGSWNAIKVSGAGSPRGEIIENIPSLERLVNVIRSKDEGAFIRVKARANFDLPGEGLDGGGTSSEGSSRARLGTPVPWTLSQHKVNAQSKLEPLGVSPRNIESIAQDVFDFQNRTLASVERGALDPTGAKFTYRDPNRLPPLEIVIWQWTDIRTG